MQRPDQRRFAVIAIVCLSALMLAALALGSNRLWAAEPLQPDPDAMLLDCDDGAVRSLAGTGGVVINNAWNRASAGKGPWRQCLQSRTREGRTEFGWFWQWPSRDGIYAYPEQLVGRSPWRDAPSNDSRFPAPIGSIKSMRIGYDIESRHQGKKNLAVEFWLTDPALSTGPAPASIQAELMIWTDESPGMNGTKPPTGEIVEIDGRQWSVLAQPNWGDASGGSGHKWLFITYRAVRHASTTRYDASRILQHAVERGWLDARWQVEGVELGNEIVSGSGSTWIRHFDLAID